MVEDSLYSYLTRLNQLTVYTTMVGYVKIIIFKNIESFKGRGIISNTLMHVYGLDIINL